MKDYLDALLSFEWLKDAGTYEQRKVACDEIDGYIIDTCYVSDCDCVETAISADDGKNWVVVEHYDDDNKAKEGHKKWVNFCKENHPDKMWDILLEEEIIF